MAWADASEAPGHGTAAARRCSRSAARGGVRRRTSPLVAVDLGGDRSQSPEFLHALADQIERWAPQRGAVVKLLRAQADHVAAGGAVRESPVARAHLVRARSTPALAASSHQD